MEAVGHISESKNSCNSLIIIYIYNEAITYKPPAGAVGCLGRQNRYLIHIAYLHLSGARLSENSRELLAGNKYTYFTYLIFMEIPYFLL